MAPHKRVNRRELILETASKLFVEQGYTETSVRQIADAVGCSEAALYYHFKDGKRELLQQVVGCKFPKFGDVVDVCRSAKTLEELIHAFGLGMQEFGPTHIRKLRWLATEFCRLDPEEQDFIRQKLLKFHQDISDEVRQFVATGEEARNLAWLLICASFGVVQLFVNLDLRSHTNFGPEQMVLLMAELISLCEK
jgi:AcrR family transcriptional regulator